MEEEGERAKEEERQLHRQREKKSEFVIKIPSYDEVLNASQSQSHPPPSLFKPSQSFSQAFSFIKSSSFYSPPPPPPPPSSASAQSQSSHASPPAASSRQSDRSDLASSSSSSAAAASSSLASQIAQNRNAILVSHRQKGNPLLKHIRNVRWAFADIVCDYLLGQSSCALYLSLRYHLLHPDYLYYRIRELQKNFKLRVVLCHVDVEDVVKPLLEVTKTALLHDCTLLCGWSLEECGRYLETIKVYENKPADIIQGQSDTDYISRLNHALTTVRHVNKTDVVTLGSTFGSLSRIMDVSMEDLARCPGIGERKLIGLQFNLASFCILHFSDSKRSLSLKVKRLYDTFHEPFKRVIPKHVTIPETSTQNKAASSSVIEENEEKEEDSSKHRKKEPEITIKSALSAAFAKYSDRIGKKNNLEQKFEESSSACGSEGKNSS